MEWDDLSLHHLKKMFFHYVSNSVIGMAGLSFNVFTDTFFIANGIGSHALAPLNVALPMFSFVSAMAIMSAMGCATRYALLKAGKHDKEADAVFAHGLVAALLQSLLLLVAGLFFTRPLAVLLGANEAIAADTAQYLFPLLTLGFLFQFNQLFICMIRNDNAPALAMKAMVIGNLVNIVLDYVFIYHFHWGLFGASLASCFSPLTSLLILSTHKLRHRNHFHWHRPKWTLALLGSIYRIGIPSFINEISSGIVMLAFNYLLLKYGGNTAIAAYGIIANLALIIQAIYSGIGQSIQPIISHLYGSGQISLSFQTARYAVVTAASLGILFVGIAFLFPTQLIAIFNSDQNAALEAIAKTGIQLYFPAFLVAGISVSLTSFFSSIHAVNESTILSLGRGIIFVLCFLLLLPPFFEQNGVWLSIPAAEWLSFIIACYFLIRIYRRLYQK